jgi:hypothetical protein
MQRSVLVAALVLAVALAAVPSGGLAQSDDAPVAPGEHFAGVVGVQEAEVEGEVATRTFGVRFARAGGDAARAAVVAEGTNETRERIGELERRRERLRAARANGSISEGQYRARMARLAAESRTLHHRLNRTAAASREVPDAALRRRGVDPNELARLQRAAGNLTGPEVAAIARGIAGPPAAVPGRAANGSRGPPADAPNRTGGPPDDATNRTARGAAPNGGPPDDARGNATDSPDSASPARDSAENETRSESGTEESSSQADGAEESDAGGSDADSDGDGSTDGDSAGPPTDAGDGSADGDRGARAP